jgi:hypothetical protein
MRASHLRALRLRLAAALVVVLILGFALSILPNRPARPAEAAVGGLHVAGNQLLDGAGRPVVLRGVNRSGTEYACIQGWGIFDGPSDAASVQAMRAWGVNGVNIGLNEGCWLGINGVPAAYGGASYQGAIKAYVALLEANGIYPVLSLFWEAPGAQKATGQTAMPDADHAPALWQSVASTFKGDSAVILRLKEEPFPAGNSDTAAAWDCWASGDVQYDTSNTLAPVSSVAHCGEGYKAVGMQSLVNIVRGAGAANVIQVPGVQYANSMTRFLAYKPADPLGNLMAVVDVYPDGNVCGSVACYDAYYAPVIQQMPFLAGEIGEDPNGSCATAGVDALMGWLDGHNSGYLAWTWDTWGGCPEMSLISDYGGTPTSPWGADFRAHLAAVLGSPTPTPAPAGPLTHAVMVPIAARSAGQPPTASPTRTATPTATATAASGRVGWSTGYYPGWEQPAYPPSMVPWGALTHLVQFSLLTGAARDGSINTTAHGLTPQLMQAAVAEAHKRNKPILISIGGAEDNNWDAACAAANRNTFIANLVGVVRQYGYDGVDLDIEQDWQSPDHPDYIACVAGVRAALDKLSPRPLLTEPGDPDWQAYMLAQVWPYLDQINLMSYWGNVMISQAGLANYTGRGIPRALLGIGVGIDDGVDGANPADCGAKAAYAAGNGYGGVMEWTVPADAALHGSQTPCFNAIAPYVPSASPAGSAVARR